MIRHTISAPELTPGVYYRTLYFSAQALDENRAEQLVAQIAAIPAAERQTDGICAVFETPFTHPLTILETFTLTEAFGNPNLRWGVRENDEIELLVVHIYVQE